MATTMTNNNSTSSHAAQHHYIFDVVPLLETCTENLEKTIQKTSRRHRKSLNRLKEGLAYTEQLLIRYLRQKITNKDIRTQTSNNQTIPVRKTKIRAALDDFEEALTEKRRDEKLKQRKSRHLNPQDPIPAEHSSSLYTSRSATDSLLFRLVVALQLCLVRIDDAHLVISGSHIHPPVKTGEEVQIRRWAIITSAGFCCLSVGLLFASSTKARTRQTRLLGLLLPKTRDGWVRVAGLGGMTMAAGRIISVQWKNIWIADKIRKSTCEIDEWIRQWEMIQHTISPRTHRELLELELHQEHVALPPDLLDAKSKRLIEYAIRNNPKPFFWQSQGEIRFLMLKRFMDVYYASVGTAIDSTEGQESNWKLPLIAGAAASFYSITGTGASAKASHVVNKRSRDLIQNAWGMVSLPAIKTLMLQASKLLKGASVADRLIIAGVPCFVLSREPAPELAATLKQQRSRTGTQPLPLVSRMSTISETASEEPSHEFDVSQRRFAGACGQYRQRDVILHLTGGGFFAHTIASDLPYLLDWSASTGAVVICPEYALLPDHTFPVALEQIYDVYSALLDGVDFGFEVNRVIVTGESAGGNLAAALCVRIASQEVEHRDHLNESVDSGDDVLSTETIRDDPIRMPDGLMLSCPALNLTLETSHSRILGTEDPVLPSGLISAISDAYLPPAFSKRDPLASPYFATDSILKQFPPTLLFAGSNDPLLDDSVAFNQRLRSCGVRSELRAAQNMPHAYWGLGTAGFPEARQVQQECQEWLKRQFTCTERA